MLREEKKEEAVRYKNPAEYEKYILRKYECMKADTYQVEISERLYYRATKDKKIEQWLEDNLSQLSYCMESLRSIIAVTGGCLVRCICHMNNYNNISTEIFASDKLSEIGQLCKAHTYRSVIRTTNVNEIEEQLHYNSIFWTSEAESAGFKAKA